MEGAGLPKPGHFWPAKAKSRQETLLLQKREEQVWRLRSAGILALCRSLGCCHFIARVEGPRGYDGDIPFMF